MAHNRPRVQSMSVTVELGAELVARAEALGIPVAAACEKGLASIVERAEGQRWLEHNSSALASSNDYVERSGLPLAAQRLF